MVRVIATRHVDFEACFNFRDLGGYAGLDGRPVRWGKLYRSMTPQYMTAADARKALTLGIELVLDLRGPSQPWSGPLGDSPANRLAVGPGYGSRSTEELETFLALAPEDALMAVLDFHGSSYGEALTAMAAVPDAPVLFHCRLGKDRTGVFAALLLKLAGVGDDDVMADYLLTGEAEPAMRAYLSRAEAEAPSREPRVAHEPIRREAIEAVLQRLVSKYGGAYGYFARFGVPARTLDAVVESLLEPAKP